LCREEGNSHNSRSPSTFEAAGVHPDTKYHPTTSIHDNQPANMSDSQVTLRTRKFIRNPLLGRKQMVVCVQSLHRAEKGSPSAAATHR
jgi:hypothetical protein